MLTLELEPEIEMTLNAVAEKEHRSPSEIIKQLINFYLKEKKESDLLIDIAKTLPKIAYFENQDPLELQKAMRDETEGEKLLAVLKKTGFLGSLPDVPDLSVNYKEHLDWSDKI
ncbi:MAG: hypothetical protein BWK79_12050 [Beggiatoa sp. IS2]|nr:MAG: hypothetical protein BWK79_12050 [Beggiatoa sp. IS2]